VPWRDLPERFGPWKSVYNRFRRWSSNEIWERSFAALKVEVDASTVRATTMRLAEKAPCPVLVDSR
jgi:transposase